jgi:hypothetical protein
MNPFLSIPTPLHACMGWYLATSSAWKSGKTRDDERGRKSNGGASKRWIFPRIYKKAKETEQLKTSLLSVDVFGSCG